MSEAQLIDILNKSYYVAGILILTNIGTIISVLYFSFKGIWWLSKLESTANSAKELAEEAKQLTIKAHGRIDSMSGVRGVLYDQHN